MGGGQRSAHTHTHTKTTVRVLFLRVRPGKVRSFITLRDFLVTLVLCFGCFDVQRTRLEATTNTLDALLGRRDETCFNKASVRRKKKKEGEGVSEEGASRYGGKRITRVFE